MQSNWLRSGHAYYAFDTPEEIENMREKLKAEGKYNLQYDFQVQAGNEKFSCLTAGRNRSIVENKFSACDQN